MDWSETLFHKAWHWLARAGKKTTGSAENQICLDPLKGRLSQFASLLTGTPIEIVSAEAEGGYIGHTFFLPRQVALYLNDEDNLRFYLFRVVFLATQREMGLNWHTEQNYNLTAAQTRATQSAPLVLERMHKQYPGIERGLAQLIPSDIQSQPLDKQVWYWGHWMASPVTEASQTHTPEAQSAQENLPKTSFEAPVKEDIKVLEKDKKAVQEYTLQHYFEKVETLEEFQGAWRETNGDDDLSDHAEALDELDLRQVMRCDDPVHSIYQAEFFLNSTTPESKNAPVDGYFLSYDEWNGKKRAYRRDYCRVYPQRCQMTSPGYYTQILNKERRTLNQLRQRLGQFFHELETVRRQRDGDILDLDALVENFADQRAGLPPSERVYLSRRKRQRDIAVLILMDLSLSTDGYTAGQRVIDVEKQAVILFGELLSEYGDAFQIDGFSSRTRNHCDYLHIKRFDEHWGKGAARIGALQPRGYTRIGPALRHATAELKALKAKKKWILLLSDGKPNDYDRYEGRYGIQDVRQAIREAEQERVHCFALAVEATAKQYLPPMLGEGRYQILARPQDLPQTLAQFYSRLLYSLA